MEQTASLTTRKNGRWNGNAIKTHPTLRYSLTKSYSVRLLTCSFFFSPWYN